MFVIKRNGTHEPVMFDKITKRIQFLAQAKILNLPPLDVDETIIAQKVIAELVSGCSTSMLDEIAANVCYYIDLFNPDYQELAGRILNSNLNKQVTLSFSEMMKHFYDNELLDEEFYKNVENNAEKWNKLINLDNNFLLSYKGIKTFKTSYFVTWNNVTETPQHVYLRVAIAIHGNCYDSVKNTYEYLARQILSHATPTLFNAGRKRQQFSSCFTTEVQDSIHNIFTSLTECALISQHAGGIGIDISNIRAYGSPIKGTGGTSNGIVPLMNTYAATAKYVDQGGGKRAGSWAMYIEPWHLDFFDWLETGKKTTREGFKADTLFLALWVPDLFMKRIESGETWTLFCPSIAKSLHSLYGDEFEELYLKLEKDESIPSHLRKTIPINQIVQAILLSHMETGKPYIMFKDAINKKSNQKHLGPIKLSNLCTEIVQYTSEDETSVCNLAAINLVSCVISDNVFDFNLLEQIAKQAVINLDIIIDKNYYPTQASKKSNLNHRPMGIGIMGLATVFQMLNLPYESIEAKKLNLKIAQTLQLATMEQSIELASKYGAYSTHKGSPESHGILQHDMWGVECLPEYAERFNTCRRKMQEIGARNVYRTAYMPTVSTALILGVSDAFYPIISNIFTKETKSGDFTEFNPILIKKLKEQNLWTRQIFTLITNNQGSLQSISSIPNEIKEIFKTVWEMKPSTLLNMEADRAPYIDQSQSASRFVTSSSQLLSLLMYANKLGLKTGMYYLRTNSALKSTQHKPQSLDSNMEDDKKKRLRVDNKTQACNAFNNGGECESCIL